MMENKIYTGTKVVSKRKLITGIILILTLYALCIVVFSPAPRGTDQYWNLGNIERVIHMDGIWKTNNIFPSGLPEDLNELPRPWVQNRPVTYAGTIFAFITNHAHAGWMVMNFLLIIFIVWSFLKIINNKNEFHWFLLPVLALLIFNPQIFYLGMQALPEVFNALLAILLLLVILKLRPVFLKAFIAAVLSGLLYYQRESFLLVFFLVPAFFYVFYISKERWISIISYVIVVAVLYSVKPVLFPSHSIEQISALDQLTEVRPGNSNMINYLHPDPAEKSSGEIIKILGIKTLAALKLQFIPSGANALFFYTVNLLLISLIILLRKYRSLSLIKKQTLFFIAGMVLIQIATIIVFENQNRFSSVLVPLLLICLFWVFEMYWSEHRFFKKGLYTLLIICIGIAGLIGYQNRKEADSDKRFVEDFKQVNEITGNSAVMVPYYGGRAIMLSYAVMPQYCYYFPGKYNWENIKEISEKLNTSWFLYPSHISFAKESESLIIETHSIGENFILSRLRLAE